MFGEVGTMSESRRIVIIQSDGGREIYYLASPDSPVVEDGTCVNFEIGLVANVVKK